MNHSITFGGKNTKTDWGLILTSQPVFDPPKQKTKTLNPPGRDGVIDLSTAVTGHPVFENRTGSFEFVSAGNEGHWYARYSEIQDYIKNQTRAVLSNDPAWYWEGRFWVSSIKAKPTWAAITISYDVAPYKWSLKKTTDAWLWDPFSFIDGVIYSSIFTGIEITTTAQTLEYDYVSAGGAPVKPVFTATGNDVVLTMTKASGSSSAKTLTAGAPAAVDGLVLYGSKWLLGGEEVTVTAATGTGTAELAIEFRAGRL